MSWYRTYRPQKIEDLDLENVRGIFTEMMQSGKIPQALIFAGPKGTGKTSSSRIIGALLNDSANAPIVDYVYFGKDKPKSVVLGEPDISTDFAKKVSLGQSFVVQEMDAASNRGIDDVRALRERVMLPPQEGKIAVYILDEAHMLTTEAFNALLKLLEEPPAHSVFILATTEFHKIPETIVSRCVVVPFRKANTLEVTRSLERILSTEKIEYEPQALDAIITYADGSFRDAVKLLELTAQSGKVTLAEVEKIIGASHGATITKLVSAVTSKNSEQVITIIEELRSADVDQKYFHKVLFLQLHRALLQDMGIEDGDPFVTQQVARFLLTELLVAKLQESTPIPFLPLELKLLEIIDRASKKGGGSTKKVAVPPVSAANDEDEDEDEVLASMDGLMDMEPAAQVIDYEIEKTPVIEEVVDQVSTPVVTPKIEPEIKPEPETVPTQRYEGDSQLLFDKWELFLMAIEEKNSTLAALMHSSTPIPGSGDGIAKVGVYYQFHKEQLMQDKFKDIIEDCGVSLIGKRLNFDFCLQETAAKIADQEENKEKTELVALAEDTLM